MIVNAAVMVAIWEAERGAIFEDAVFGTPSPPGSAVFK